LAAVAQAIRLTVEEAIGNASAFSRQTLQRRLEDLSTLESLFVETVSQTAASAAGFTRKRPLEVAEHARASGSAVGTAAKEGVPALGRAVAETVSDQVEITTSVLSCSAKYPQAPVANKSPWNVLSPYIAVIWPSDAVDPEETDDLVNTSRH
jgi:hypothetical protein